jgi:predicted RND superfamily exporter protein
VLIPCGLLTATVPFIERDLGFLAMLEVDDPMVAELSAIDAMLNLAGGLTLLLEGGDEEQLEAAAFALETELAARPDVAQVIARPPSDWLEVRAPWIVDRGDFDAWTEVALHPGALGGAADLIGRMQERRQTLDQLVGDGHRLVFVQMTVNPLSLELAAPDFPAIEAATEEILKAHGVRGAYAGIAAAGAQDQVHVIGIITMLTPLSLLLVLVILRLAERRVSHLLLVGAAMLVALGAGTGASGLITGKLTAISGFFGIMVFGLGIDFALHLLVRLREERAAGKTIAEAVPDALGTTGVGVVVGAITTAGAFGTMAFAPEPTAMHLGVSGAVGLLFCVVLMVTLLPAGLVLLADEDDPSPPPPFRFVWVERLAGLSAQWPRTVLLAACLLVGLALAGLPRFAWESDLEEVFTRDVPAAAVADRIEGLFGLGDPWLVAVADLEEARRTAAGFEESDGFIRADSLASVLREDLGDRVALLNSRSAALREAATEWGRLRDAAPLPMRMMLAQGAELATRIVKALEVGPPSIESLPTSLRSQWVAPDGRLLVRSWTRTKTMDGLEARTMRVEAQAIHPRATSMVMFYELTMGSERPWVKYVVLGIFLLVLFVLVVDLRSPVYVLLALLPVGFGATVTLGVLCWAGVHFNILTALTVPLLIGLGVDDGIHVIHRIRENRDGPPEQAAASVGQAMVLTTLTTCASFGVLLFSNHPGLESMALVCMVGLPLCLLASVMMVPAAAKLLIR